MPNFTPPFSLRQQKAIALTPKFFAFPSIVGSIFIAQHVLRSPKRRSGVYHRLLMMMSIHDCLYAVKSFVSTWPMPSETLFTHGAVGNTATCTAAGFLGHGGSLTSIIYSGTLTLYFLFVVKFGWKEDYIKQHVEIWLHFIPLLIGWSTAIAGLPLNLYNAFGWTCWINTYPLGCIDGVNCLRGHNAGLYRWAFFHAELWIAFGFSFIAMCIIYSKILQQEKIMERYLFGHSSRNNIHNQNHRHHDTSSTLSGHRNPEQDGKSLSREHSTKFAMQATFYVVVFFFTWCFPMLQAIFSLSNGTLYYPLIMLSAILSSLQGFSNAVIYLRPRWIRYRENHPDESAWRILFVYTLGSMDTEGPRNKKRRGGGQEKQETARQQQPLRRKRYKNGGNISSITNASAGDEQHQQQQRLGGGGDVSGLSCSRESEDNSNFMGTRLRPPPTRPHYVSPSSKLSDDDEDFSGVMTNTIVEEEEDDETSGAAAVAPAAVAPADVQRRVPPVPNTMIMIIPGDDSGEVGLSTENDDGQIQDAVVSRVLFGEERPYDPEDMYME